MKLITSLLLVVLVRKGTGNSLCVTEDIDPCTQYDEELPYVATRHPSVLYSSATDDTKFCDLFALKYDHWYRSTYSMTNHCVDHRSCGTSDPIYLKGDNPTAAEGVVNGTACVRTFLDCCEDTLNLRMKNCEHFMVYCFLELNPNCHSRFCFDVDIVTETTTKVVTESLTTTATSETSTTTATTHSSRAMSSSSSSSSSRSNSRSNTITSLPSNDGTTSSSKSGEEKEKTTRLAPDTCEKVLVPVFVTLMVAAFVMIVTQSVIIWRLKRNEGIKQAIDDEPPEYVNDIDIPLGDKFK